MPRTEGSAVTFAGWERNPATQQKGWRAQANSPPELVMKWWMIAGYGLACAGFGYMGRPTEAILTLILMTLADINRKLP